jgi:hypothetical protein
MILDLHDLQASTLATPVSEKNFFGVPSSVNFEVAFPQLGELT